MLETKLIVRVKPSLLARFRRAARADRRKLSDWVRVTLESALVGKKGSNTHAARRRSAGQIAATNEGALSTR